MVGVVPSMVGAVPSMVGVVSSMVGVVPSMVGAVPNMVGVVPSMRPGVSVVRGAARAFSMQSQRVVGAMWTAAPTGMGLPVGDSEVHTRAKRVHQEGAPQLADPSPLREQWHGAEWSLSSMQPMDRKIGSIQLN